MNRARPQPARPASASVSPPPTSWRRGFAACAAPPKPPGALGVEASGERFSPWVASEGGREQPCGDDTLRSREKIAWGRSGIAVEYEWVSSKFLFRTWRT